MIDRYTLEDSPPKTAKKFVRWAEKNSGLWDLTCDGIRIRRLLEP
jgi:hypothetical protein